MFPPAELRRSSSSSSLTLQRVQGDPSSPPSPPVASLWLLGPSCMQSRCQPGQGGQRLPHKGGNKVWRGSHTHAHAQSPALPPPYALSISVHMLFTHMRSLSFTHTTHTTHTHGRVHARAHTHSLWAGLELGTGRAGAVCLSVISIPAGGSWPWPDI